MSRKIQRSLMAALVAVLMVATVVAPAHARYIYYPGERIYVKSGGTTLRCTGAYTVTLGGRMYQLTAGHCGPVGSTVAYDSTNFGTISKNGYQAGSNGSFSGFDHSLITMTLADSTPWQQVKNPATGLLIYPTGKVYSILHSQQMTQGLYVAKAGSTTGVTSGPISAYTRWGVDLAYCATMRTLPGDSGGPVFRSVGEGLAAAGVLVAYASGGSVGCFIPMDEVLRRWGATLNSYSGALYPAPPVVFPAAAAAGVAPHAAPDFNGLPYLDPSELHDAALP